MKKWTERESIFLVFPFIFSFLSSLPPLGEGSFSAVAMKAEEPSGGGGFASLLSLVHESEPIQCYDDVADEWDDERHHEIRGISDHTHE